MTDYVAFESVGYTQLWLDYFQGHWDSWGPTFAYEAKQWQQAVICLLVLSHVGRSLYARHHNTRTLNI